MTKLTDAYPLHDGHEYVMVLLKSDHMTADQDISIREQTDICVRIEKSDYNNVLNGEVLADDTMDFSNLEDLESFMKRTNAVETDGLRGNEIVRAHTMHRNGTHPDGSLHSSYILEVHCKNGNAHDAVINGEQVPAYHEACKSSKAGFEKNHHYEEGYPLGFDGPRVDFNRHEDLNKLTNAGRLHHLSLQM